MAKRGGGAGAGVDVPVEIGDARTVAQIREIIQSLDKLEQEMLSVEAATPEVSAQIDVLGKRFAAGEIDALAFRKALKHLAGDTPKSAAELKKLSAAAEDASDEVERAGEATAAVGDKAAAAAPKIKKAAEATKQVGTSAKEAKTDIGGMALDFNEITEAAGKVKDAIAAVIHAAEEADRAQTAIRNLGNGWAEVQRQTNSTTTAQHAAAAQQTITRAGLRLSGEELGRITRFTREYALATGTDATQQLERFTDALTGGSADALQEFGLRVTEGASRAHLMEQALAGIERQQRGQAPVARTFAEDTARLTTSLGEATSALALMGAEGLGLQGIISALGTEVQSLVGDLQDVIATRRDAARTNAEVIARREATAQYERARRDASEALSASGATPAQVEAFRARLARTNTLQLTPEQITAASRALQERVGALRGTTQNSAGQIAQNFVGDRNRRNDLGVSGNLGFTNQTGAELFTDERRFTVTLIARRGQQGRDRRELENAASAFATALEHDLETNAAAQRRRNRQQPRDRNNVGGPAAATAAELAEAQIAMSQARLGAFGAGLGDRLGLTTDAVDSAARTSQDARIEALRRRAMQTGAQGQENEAQRLTRVAAAIREYTEAVQERAAAERTLNDQLQASATAQKDRDDALTTQLREAQRAAMDTRQQGVERRFQEREQQAQLRTARTGDEQRPGERLSDLREQHAALQSLIDATTARIEALRAEGAAQSEVNAEIQRRVGLTTSMIAVDREATAIERERSSATRAWKDAMTGSLGSVADAFGAATEAAINGTESFEDALQQQLRAVLVTLAKESVVQVLKNLGMAAYNAAIGNVPAATNHLTAAGLWGAAGVAAGVGAAAIPQKKEAAAASPGGGSTGAGRAAQLPSRVQEPAEGPLTIQINVSGAMMNEGVEESVVRALDRAGDRGLRPRFYRALEGRRG